MKNAVILLVGALAVGSACASSHGKTMGAYRSVREGGQASFSGEQPFIAVAPDAQAYARMWNALIGRGEPPAIDFSKETAVLLFAGTRRTGGYNVVLQSVSITGSNATVSAVVKGPGRGSVVTQAFTSPFLVIAVPHPKLGGATWVDAVGKTVTDSKQAQSQ